MVTSSLTSGVADDYTYVYDRYGNRWQQNALDGGPSPSFTFNKSTNQIVGFSYDAAGKITNDGYHSYSYDAEGSLTQVDSGATAKYTYDALNQRVRIDEGGTSHEFVFNVNGQRISTWDAASHGWFQGQVYWDGIPIEFNQDGAAHFQHPDYQGTERSQTSYNGGVEGTYTSLPFGDGYSVSGSDIDPYHFAMLDKDYYGSADSGTDHAQFRQYSDTQGRWGNWQSRQVSEVFRQALCSLATSLVHSAVVRA